MAMVAVVKARARSFMVMSGIVRQNRECNATRPILPI